MFNKHDKTRDAFMLTGSFARKGYDWWWHSFTAVNEKTGEEKPFFIEYFGCNPDLGGAAPVFGQLPEKKKPSYVCVKAGCWGEDKVQLHRFFGWKNASIGVGNPFVLIVDDCYASDTAIRGHIKVSKDTAKNHPEMMTDAGEMSWDLSVYKNTAFNVGYGAGGFFRFLKAFEMYWHAEGMKSLYSGYVIYNGEKYIVDASKCYGYADKNWGSDFTSPWVWLSSCDLKSNLTGKKLENSVFDIGGGCPKVFGIPLSRKLLCGFYYEGKEYEFNFSKFWTKVETEFSFEEEDDKVIWDVKQSNKNNIMETHVECFKKDMIFVNYEAPDGRKRHNRLFNGGNGTGTVKLYKKTSQGPELIDDISIAHVGCEYGEYDK